MVASLGLVAAFVAWIFLRRNHRERWFFALNLSRWSDFGFRDSLTAATPEGEEGGETYD
jgi:hypothetical protein